MPTPVDWGAIVPPGQVVSGTHTLTCAPLYAVSTVHVVPVGQTAVAEVQDAAQKLSPRICAQTPPPQSPFERHSVHSATDIVGTPDGPASVVTLSPVTTPPSGPMTTSASPVAQPAPHPAAPTAARTDASINQTRSDLFITRAMSAGLGADLGKVTAACRSRYTRNVAVRVNGVR